ncbi:MAG: polysaccharide pyruvyl transferase family protein, partial [Pseudomonadota bacterium]
ASDNVGDEIIVSEVRHFVSELFGDAYISTSSSHDGLGHYGRALVESADIVLLLGTNALTAKYQRRGHFVWEVGRRDLAALEGKVVMFGVGASKDFETVQPRQARLLKRLLSSQFTHSVRDETGRKLLEAVGINAANTSCPTLWRYRVANPQVPAGKAPAACFTLTMHKAHSADGPFIDTLRECYDRIYFWPQQLRDLAYLKSITSTDDIQIVPPNLVSYDDLLTNTDVDVVGTRLHGGIRGLRHGRRVLITTIDNRARDIGKETGLPTVARGVNSADLAKILTSDYPTELSLPTEAIAQFLDQFRAT